MLEGLGRRWIPRGGGLGALLGIFFASGLLIGSALGGSLLLAQPAAAQQVSSLKPKLERARELLWAGQASQAKAAYEAVEMEARVRRDAPTLALARLGVGDAWSLRSGWDEAAAAYEEAYEVAGTSQMSTSQAPDPDQDLGIAEAARWRGIWVDSLRRGRGGDRHQLEDLLQDALRQAEAAGDRWAAARLLSRLVEMPTLSSDPAAALVQLDDALGKIPQDNELKDIFGQAALLRPRGRVLLDLGRAREAEDSLNRARALLRGSDTPGLTSRVLQDLGILHSRGGSTARALEMYQEAATHATELPRAYAACLRNIGVIYAKQGNYPLARQAMEEALRTSQEQEDRPGQVRTLQNLGQLGAHFGDLESARDYFARSMPLVVEVLKPAEQASSWVNLGRLELEAGDLGRGEEAFRKALELAKGLPGSSAVLEARLGLGEAALRRNDFALALKLGQEASGSSQGEVFRRGRVLTARAQRALGKTDDALATLLGAVEVTEDRMARIAGGARDQELFLDDSFQVYGELIDLLAQRGEVEAAFSWAERVKGRSLLRALDSSQGPKPRSREQRDQEATLVERLTTLNQDRFRLQEASNRRSPEAHRSETQRVQKDLERARLELERFRSGLYAEQEGLRRARADVAVFDPSAPGEAWPLADTAVLEMVTLETKTFLFVLRGAPRRLQLREVPVGWRELAGLTEQLRRRLADRSPAYTWAAQRLYQLLIAPVEQDLVGVRQICVVPDGPLWDVPLQLLGPKGGKILAERFILHTAPSVSLLASLRSLRETRVEAPRRAPPGSLLAVGDPAFSKQATALVSGLRGFSPLARLPEAAHEAREVAAAYGQNRETVKVLIGDQARESRVKVEAGRFRTLHFATHALMDDRNPSFSTLVLAPDAAQDDAAQDDAAQQDGLLETWEVSSLDLDADLVVLAGCQTHRGRVPAARGLMGLSWAFAAAGSSAVVASHWDVDSKATRELMVRFHRLRQGGASTAEALRQAALAVRQQPKFQHPFYWAGFTLVGVPD